MNKELDQALLDTLEAHLNKWANSICSQYRLHKNSFRITVKQQRTPPKSAYGYLVQDGSYHAPMASENSIVRPKRTYIQNPGDPLRSYSQTLATVVNGSVVIVTVFVPLLQQTGDLKEDLKKTVGRMKSTIKRLLKYISTPRLHGDTELFNPLIIGDVEHSYIVSGNNRVWKKRKIDAQKKNNRDRNEFSITTTTKVIFKHKITGIEYSTEVRNHKRNQWDMEQECWDKCSELVNSKLAYIPILTSRCTDLAPIKYTIAARFISEKIRVRSQLYGY